VGALVAELAAATGVRVACQTLGVSRAGFYRQRRPPPAIAPSAHPRPARALSAPERQAVLAVVHSDRFVDAAPAQIYATLLDEGQYLCSERTMYRLLTQATEVQERRNQARHPVYTRPELLAEAPNQVWSWDITKLYGPSKYTYFYLYVILDIFSRAVVGWHIAYRETAELAEAFIAETTAAHAIPPGQLTVHADRGAPMTAKVVAQLLADLGVAKSHSRPHVSNDNPYSESHFKTLKYRPDFPKRFGSIEDARAFGQGFFTWYNTEHRHSGIGGYTPQMVHTGQAAAARIVRQTTLDGAYATHPERFVRHAPVAAALPIAAWINPPSPEPRCP